MHLVIMDESKLDPPPATGCDAVARRNYEADIYWPCPCQPYPLFPRINSGKVREWSRW